MRGERDPRSLGPRGEVFFHRRPKKRCDVCLCQSVSPTAQTDVAQRSSRGAPDNEAPQGAPQVEKSFYFYYGRKSFYYGFHYGSKHFYYGFYYDRVGFWAETNRGGKIVLHFHGSIRGGPYCPYGNP